MLKHAALAPPGMRQEDSRKHIHMVLHMPASVIYVQVVGVSITILWWRVLLVR